MPDQTHTSRGTISAARHDHKMTSPISFSQQSCRHLSRIHDMIGGLTDRKFSNSVVVRVAVEALASLLDHATVNGAEQTLEHFRNRIWQHSSQRLRRAKNVSGEQA